jgi:hypothetical protein
MRWHGHTLGAMNVFHATPEPATADGRALGQAFADIATIVLIQTTDVSLQQVTANVQEALSARTTIERAKGVLAYRRGVDRATAYDLLVAMVGAESTITATAVQVIATAQRPSRPQPSKP